MAKNSNQIQINSKFKSFKFGVPLLPRTISPDFTTKRFYSSQLPLWRNSLEVPRFDFKLLFVKIPFARDNGYQTEFIAICWKTTLSSNDNSGSRPRDVKVRGKCNKPSGQATKGPSIGKKIEWLECGLQSETDRNLMFSVHCFRHKIIWKFEETLLQETMSWDSLRFSVKDMFFPNLGMVGNE